MESNSGSGGMICPHCQQPIDPALIAAERNRELASRKRPGSKGNASRNPWGRKGKKATSVSLETNRKRKPATE